MLNNKHIPIFLASNNKYAPFVTSLISSICYNTKHYIEFYILDGDISSINKTLIKKLINKFNNCSVEFIKINFTKYFKHFKQSNQWSLDVYSRFLIPYLKADLKKVIYLDVDIIVLDDISKLYNINIDGYGLGAVPDVYNFVEHKKQFIKDNLKKYFNSGVLLIDCEYWRKHKIFERLLELEKQYKDKILFFDQDLLNICFENNYKILDYYYNLQTEQIFNYKNLNDDEITNIKEYIAKPFIRHFSSNSKPWLSNKIIYDNKILNMPNFNEFWFFLKMTDFYDIIFLNFIAENENGHNNFNINITKKFKLFHYIPIIKIKYRNNKTKIYLFNIIPLLTIKQKNE